MSERISLQKVFEGILSSQSFELLKGFSDDATWGALDPEERELLTQLFLLNAERASCVGEEEQRRLAKESYKRACLLSPASARVWYRLGAFLALSEDKQELREACQALYKAVSIESRFFDAQYALGSVSLRLAVLDSDEQLLSDADASFFAASTLVEEKALPAEFYWHWGIVWSVIAKHTAEPSDMKRALTLFSKAHGLGCRRPDFFNDYANVLVELALSTANDELIHSAISLYQAAIDTSGASSEKERGVRFFNLGCCYQHLFEVTCEREFFEKARHAFEVTTTFYKDLFAAWQRYGFLLFKGWRVWRTPAYLEKAIVALKRAEKNGCASSLSLAITSQAIVWNEVTRNSESSLPEASEYAERAVALKEEELHPELFVARALVLLERGRYFDELFYIENALTILQDGIALFPRSAILWQAIASTKWAQADMLDDVASLQDALVAYAIASRSFFSHSPHFWSDWGVSLLTLAELSDDAVIALEAVTMFERACELSQEKDAVLLYHMGRALHFIGDTCDEEEYFDRAIAVLTEAFIQDDSSIPVVYQLGSCYLHVGELTSDKNAFSIARLYYEELLSKDPEDETAWMEYALTLIQLGVLTRSAEQIPQEWFRAEEALCMAEQLGQPLVYYYQACLCSLMGNFPEAMEALHCALREGELPDVQDMLDDEWLEPLMRTARCQEFLKEAEKAL